MTFLPRTTALLSLVLLTLGVAVQPAFAQESDQLDGRMSQVQTRMNEMKHDMTAIEDESDSKKRQRMLRDHMEDMHEAMAMMQKEMLPSMRRIHRHKQSPSAARSKRTEAYDSEEHLERMDQMMNQMESLIGQMSDHRRAMRDRANARGMTIAHRAHFIYALRI